MFLPLAILGGAAALWGFSRYVTHTAAVDKALENGWGFDASTPDAAESAIAGSDLRKTAAADRAEACRQLAVQAKSLLRTRNWPEEDEDSAALMIVAHACLETGWLLHFVDSNIFGVNAVGAEPYVYANDNGNQRKFRVYVDVREALEAYVALLDRNYPDWENAARAADSDAYAAALKHGRGGRAYYELAETSFARAHDSIYTRLITMMEAW